MSKTQQIAVPVTVPIEEIARKTDFPQSVSMCAELAGYNLEKQACAGLKMDKSQWTRVKNGTAGIIWSRLEEFMNEMGNDAPVLWMAYQRGYDLHAMRKRETESEKRIRELEEKNQRLQLKNEALVEALRGGAQ